MNAEKTFVSVVAHARSASFSKLSDLGYARATHDSAQAPHANGRYLFATLSRESARWLVSVSKIAIKLLTASDLSFFGPHLERSKQKGINLNADVFLAFYPGLKGQFNEIGFPLAVIGPGAQAQYTLRRKVLRTPGAKNWRLNGEIINNPPGEPSRYDELQSGDFAIMAFDGATAPEALTLVLVSAAQDQALHAVIAAKYRFEERHSMVAIPQTDLVALLNETSDAYAATTAHPLQPLFAPDTVEEAIFGSPVEQRATATTNGKGAALSPERLKLQLQAAEDSGRRGEEAFKRWLDNTGHEEDDYEWVSREYARAAFDFHIKKPRWPGEREPLYIDVKATKGAFDSPIHMSMAEIRWAADHDTYRLARVFDLDATPTLALLGNVQHLAQQLVAKLASLPDGVTVDGVSLDVGLFSVLHRIELPIPEE